MSDRLRAEAAVHDQFEQARALSRALRRVRELEAEAAALRMENAVLRERWPERGAQALRPAA